MKAVFLYRPESEHARAVETFLRDFKMRNPAVKVEVISIDSREGIAMASLYDVMQYPAILAVANDGVLLQLWQGEMLPLMDEVASYARSSR